MIDAAWLLVATVVLLVGGRWFQRRTAYWQRIRYLAWYALTKEEEGWLKQKCSHLSTSA